MSACLNGSVIAQWGGSCDDESDSMEIGGRSRSEQQGDDEFSCSCTGCQTGGGVFGAGFVITGCSLVCFGDGFFYLGGKIYGLVFCYEFGVCFSFLLSDFCGSNYKVLADCSATV